MTASNRPNRRSFLRQVTSLAAASLLVDLMSPAVGRAGSDAQEALSRQNVIGKLRRPIKKLLKRLEKRTALTVRFRALKPEFPVVAQYSFEQPDRPIIHLRRRWQDVDVAHELMHMKLELLEGYSVLAWRRGVPRDKAVELALGLIRSYTDDMLVFRRLARMGLEIDGEVIKPQFFDDLCANVTRYLRAGHSLSNDGMAHLDNVAGGRYADLRRSTFLVQAELIKDAYSDRLAREHKQLLHDFIAAFRLFRPEQARRADAVLALFHRNDIEDIAGHAAILSEWAAMEQLDQWVGVSRYVRRDGGFVLPFPGDIEPLLSPIRGPDSAVV